jgi:hypothetical protein
MGSSANTAVEEGIGYHDRANQSACTQKGVVFSCFKSTRRRNERYDVQTEIPSRKANEKRGPKASAVQGQSRPYLGSDDLDFDSEVEVARAKATQANETAGT